MDISEESKVLSPREGQTLNVEPGELLEEGWFFGNFLDRKTRIMSRCFSDPSPSSKVSQQMLVERSFEETYSSIIKKVSFPADGIDGGEVFTPPPPPPPRSISLMRTPSMPSPNRIKSSSATPNITKTTSNNRLQRTPSLPAMDMDMNNNIEDEESDYSMGRLIRQASLGQSNKKLPPRQNIPKKSTPWTIPKQQYPRRRSEQEGTIQRRRQEILEHEKIKNSSPANIETEQAKDLKGSSDMNSPIIKMLQKLQEEKIMEEEEEDSSEIVKVRKAYVPEERRLERTTSASTEGRRLERTSSSASPVLDNIVRPRTTDDMKAQIKFWARAVASNVR